MLFRIQIRIRICYTAICYVHDGKKEAVLGIRIQVFLGLPDPDPLVRGTDQDLVSDPSFSHKGRYWAD